MRGSALENPLPHLRVAKDSLTRVARLQRDLWLADAELKTIVQAKRGSWAALAAVSFLALVGLTSFWVMMGLHERGWSAFSLAGLSFLFFGALTAVFVGFALGVGARGDA